MSHIDPRMPVDPSLLDSPSAAELARNLVLDVDRLIDSYTRLRMSIGLMYVSLPDELEQHAKSAFLEFVDADPNTNPPEYRRKMRILQRLLGIWNGTEAKSVPTKCHP